MKESSREQSRNRIIHVHLAMIKQAIKSSAKIETQKRKSKGKEESKTTWKKDFVQFRCLSASALFSTF